MTGAVRGRVDVAVVGAGPCGLAVAIAVQARGLTCELFDRESVVSSIAAYPTYITFFSTAEKIAIGGIPFSIAAEKPTRRDAMAYYRGVVTHFGLRVRQYEPVTAVERGRDEFVVHSETAVDGQRTTRASAVVIATGYFGTPNRLGVPGEDLPHVTHYYCEGHYAFDRDAVVVGGGNSGVETALDLYRCGARVAVVHFGPTFDRNIKPWVKPDFDGRVSEGGIAMRWNARVKAIEPGRVHLATLEGDATLSAEHVYLMTGFTPAPGLLAGLGARVDPATGVPAHDPATMETNVPGVFVAGVLVSGFDANRIFIENGRDHGELIGAAVKSRKPEAGSRKGA